MKWHLWILILLAVLCLLVQHTRLSHMEAQLAILEDTCQRQGLQLKELTAEVEALKKPDQGSTQPLEEIVRKYMGYFDDHDVSGLLED